MSEGGTERQALQDRHKDVLDRLEKEDANRPAYGVKAWNMPRSGYDTRGDGEINRPLVLGEIGHPDDPSKKVPVILREGIQKTSKPNGKGHGRRHIEFRHGQELRDLGFHDALDFVYHIIRHHNEDIDSSHYHSRNLALRHGKNPGLKSILHLISQEDHYRATTAYPEAGNILNKQNNEKG